MTSNTEKFDEEFNGEEEKRATRNRAFTFREKEEIAHNILFNTGKAVVTTFSESADSAVLDTVQQTTGMKILDVQNKSNEITVYLIAIDVKSNARNNLRHLQQLKHVNVRAANSIQD